MSTKRVVSVFLLLSLAVAPAGVAGPAAAAPKEQGQPTARAWLADARAEALKWQADAVLVNVTTDSANPDGSAGAWSYLFDSPKAGQQAAVMVDASGPMLFPSPGTAFRAPLGEFVDSDKAMAAAVAAGMKTRDYGMKMSLSTAGRAEWFMSDRDYGYTIDAATGKLLSKE